MLHFLGIPYAQPPISDLRWMPPEPAKPWTGMLDATHFRASCAQSEKVGGFAAPSEAEDCLFLNVFVKAQDRAASAHRHTRGKSPVMVWLPGGGFFAGASNDYDPSALVLQGDVVFVSINYRLGLLGFFSHPAIDAEGHAHSNYGLMDQQLALKWVRDNISDFGGDPGNVTIFGESAGGLSVLSNIASPLSKGLFNKAIVESAAPVDLPPSTAMQRLGTAFAEEAGCKNQTAECLRSLSVSTILRTNAPAESGNPGSSGVPGGSPFGRFGAFLQLPMIDGTVLTEPMSTAFAHGRFNKVPILYGSNHDESTWFIALAELSIGTPLTTQTYPDIIARNFGSSASDVMERYPLASFPTPSNAIAAALTDRDFICATRRTIQALKPYVESIYYYRFDDRDAPVSSPNVSFPYLAHHTAELQYIFSGFHGAGGRIHQLRPAQAQLARHMVRYWTNFATSGDPNRGTDDASATVWPRYDLTGDQFLSLKVPQSSAVTGLGDFHQCGFWDGVSASQAGILGKHH